MNTPRLSPDAPVQGPCRVATVPIIIAGPTAVGKSALGMSLARRAGGEIIAADCMQVYRGMDVGTGKPSPGDREAVPHHLLDIRDPAESFSASEFAAWARSVVNAIRGRGRLPILVGGTGLYLRAFLKGGLTGTGGDPAIRARLTREAETSGSGALHERLRRLDPATAERVRAGDRVRIIRALELLELTGRRASEIRPDLWDPPRVAVSAFLVLDRDRAELHRLIEERARRMWEGGLVEEVRHLLQAGCDPAARALQSLGYRQALAWLQGRMSAGDALADMQRATRQYARRQLTWFRREPAAEWIRVTGQDWVGPLAEEICARLATQETRAREGEG